MTNKTREVVQKAVREIIDGTQATARPISDAESALSDHALYVAGRLSLAGPGSAALADAITAAYHLGRQHALERVAIGIDMSVAEAWRQSVDQARSNRAAPDALED